MNKKTRLIILLVCIACFFAISPVLIFYSMGDRFDFKKMKITETGGIYVRTNPSAEKIIIDSKTAEKPGLFANSIFVQSLLPKNHTVLIQKTGYYDYFKTLPVLEKQVTKLENVLLIKNNLRFDLVSDKTQSPFANQEKFTIKNNGLYYSDSAQNIGVPAATKAVPLIKNIVALSTSANSIIWLGTDGFMYKSDLASLAAKTLSSPKPVKITLQPLKIVKNGAYKLIQNGTDLFAIANGSLLLLDQKKLSLNLVYDSVKNIRFSPDGLSAIVYDDNNIYLSVVSQEEYKKTLLYKSADKINDCIWLNNDYIVFSAGNKITISEIDYRGNVNSVTLPEKITVTQENIVELKNPQIFFKQAESKLYILTGTTLLASEKFIP